MEFLLKLIRMVSMVCSIFAIVSCQEQEATVKLHFAPIKSISFSRDRQVYREFIQEFNDSPIYIAYDLHNEEIILRSISNDEIDSTIQLHGLPSSKYACHKLEQEKLLIDGLVISENGNVLFHEYGASTLVEITSNGFKEFTLPELGEKRIYCGPLLNIILHDGLVTLYAIGGSDSLNHCGSALVTIDSTQNRAFFHTPHPVNQHIHEFRDAIYPSSVLIRDTLITSFGYAEDLIAYDLREKKHHIIHPRNTAPSMRPLRFRTKEFSSITEYYDKTAFFGRLLSGNQSLFRVCFVANKKESPSPYHSLSFKPWFITMYSNDFRHSKKVEVGSSAPLMGNSLTIVNDNFYVIASQGKDAFQPRRTVEIYASACPNQEAQMHIKQR